MTLSEVSEIKGNLKDTIIWTGRCDKDVFACWKTFSEACCSDTGFGLEE